MRQFVRNLWAEFKVFAFQGNLIELAVAVVIGGAFSGLIHALVVDTVNPTITYAVTAVREANRRAAAVAHVATDTVGLTAHHDDAAPAAGTPVVTAGGTPVVTAGGAAVVTGPAPAQSRVVGETPAGQAAVPGGAGEVDAPRAVQFQWMIGRYPVGHLIGEAVNFTVLSFVVFLVIVKLLGGMVPLPGTAGRPATRECPECLSIIPTGARRCSHCTAVLVATARRPGRTGPARPTMARPMMAQVRRPRR